MSRKIAVAITAFMMVLGLPVIANAIPVFVNVSGVVSSMTLQVSMIDRDGRLKKDTVKFSKGVDKGAALVDNINHFVELEDVVVFSASNIPQYSSVRLEILGSLLNPESGNTAGPASFELISPVDVPRNGTQLVIDGAAGVSIKSTSKGDKITVVTKFQPSSVAFTTYTAGLAVVTLSGDAKITLPAMVKSAR